MKKYQDGDIITGIVTGIEDYGIFLSFGDNLCGLIHISEISDSFVKNVFDYAKINDSVTAKILSVDTDGHYKLSIKALDEVKKVDTHHIIETKSGFDSLEKSLPDWIDEAYDELEKK